MATAAIQGEHSGRVESEFVLDLGEFDGVKAVLSESTTGVWKTPDRAHLSITFSRQGLPSVEIDGRTIEIPDHSETYEVIVIGDDVYVMGVPQGYEQRGDARTTRDDYNDNSFDLFYFFDYHRLLGFYYRGSEAEFWLPEELADEISMVEQELNGEDVYYITGPPAIYRNYPVIGASALDGVLEYWIGSEDYLLRRFEVSGVMCEGEDFAQRLNGWISLSDFGEPVDIQRPVHEGADDHGNAPTNATEILVGEPITGSVDSWLDSDYFRFQAEEGRLYHIVVSDERAYNKAYGTHSTLFGPDGVTPESTFSGSSGQLGTRIVWQAPASDTYYLRVESGQQGADVYTLTVTLLPEEDDYGDDPSTAYEIGIDEAVEGLIGQLNDRDYFKFTAGEGQVYRIDTSPHLQENRPDVVLHGPGGQLQEARSFGSLGSDTERILWVAPSQGDYYISVEFRDSSKVGSYTLRVVSITDIVDDHSDGAANATHLSIGEGVRGALDYEFDIDYFSFSAEEGHGYRVDIDYGTLRFSDLTLLAPDGFTPEPLEKYTHSDRDGYRLLWTAPEAGTYHLEVKNVSGRTGEYTITVTAVEAVLDDHGNKAETATDISIGETVQGLMDYEFDLDYFRFMANEGQEYLMHVDHQTLGHSRVKIYAADGITESSPYSSSSSLNEGSTHRWRADTSSEYFVEVESGSGSLGAYTLVIDAVGG